MTTGLASHLHVCPVPRCTQWLGCGWVQPGLASLEAPRPVSCGQISRCQVGSSGLPRAGEGGRLPMVAQVRAGRPEVLGTWRLAAWKGVMSPGELTLDESLGEGPGG